ncbi:hypothetical protein XA68_14478 [Ophiocordyceps unilateralis]|uniref:Thioredoxin domain-containing protein n=1 Tax=Ophiocordyceps unilateralis TaxID=268505 RepID=A0A2A9P8W6_OPHUN|nr:hypothetical protein XA68_14478 [Ophiocordyceps unilateralis]
MSENAYSSDKVPDIESKQQLDGLLDRNPFLVLQAHATWCAPCKAISPLFRQQAEDLARPEVLAFARFDSGRAEDLVHELGIQTLPTFVFFENGEKIQSLTGANHATLQKAVEDIRAKADAAFPRR